MTARKLTPAERLIVAADFKPGMGGRKAVRKLVLTFAESIQGTGVVIKFNSVLRALGYDLIDEMHDLGLKVMADLKLNDIGETLSIDGIFLREAQPEIVTVMCGTGVASMTVLAKELPRTEVLGVTVLTTLDDEHCKTMFCCSTEEAALRLADLANASHIGGLVSSPKEAPGLRSKFYEKSLRLCTLCPKFGTALSLNTPGIRPAWALVQGDDQNQNRVMTPAKAILAGADRLVVGRPITQAPSPLDAIKWTIEEIEMALV